MMGTAERICCQGQVRKCLCNRSQARVPLCSVAIVRAWGARMTHGRGNAFGPDAGTGITPQDAQLIRACLESAPNAWDEFVDRFAGLFAYAVDRTSAQRQMPLSSVDRDDVIAEILVAILKNDAAVLRAFAGRSSLPTYLTVIARRVAVKAMDRTLQPALERRPLSDTEHPGRRDPQRDLIDREEIEVLLGRLDEPDARLVRLHHLEERSYGEISRLTGLPLGSIGPALSKAREKMRGQP